MMIMLSRSWISSKNTPKTPNILSSILSRGNDLESRKFVRAVKSEEKSLEINFLRDEA
jgi:CRISPR/Cas system endoribonuclease Cas6 (RAMP superfamily)